VTQWQNVQCFEEVHHRFNIFATQDETNKQKKLLVSFEASLIPVLNSASQL